MTLQEIRTRLMKGCDKELSQTPDILVCGEEGLFEDTIYCDSCQVKLALLDELEPLVIETIDKWIDDWNINHDSHEGEGELTEKDRKELKQKILGGEGK